MVIEMPIEDAVAADAKGVFESIGLDMPTAVMIFLRRAVQEGGLPFEMRKDPFYSEANMAFLREGIEEYNRGNFHEHELADLPDEEDLVR